MSISAPVRILVATAGLDLLPSTRLRVACPLLAADHFEAVLVPWDGGAVDVLVADLSSAQGSSAAHAALAAQVAVLPLGHAASGWQDAGLQGLPHTASVREIAAALRALLLGQGAAPLPGADKPAAVAAGRGDATALQPLLEQLRLDQPRRQRVLLEHGLLRLVAEPATGTLYMLRRMPLEALVERALESDWRITAVDERDWQEVHQHDVCVRLAIETVWWRILARPEFSPPLMTGRPLALAAWPDLDPANADPAWLMPLACMLQRPWLPGELSKASGCALEMVHCVMSVVHLSGLADVDGGRRREHLRTRAAPGSGHTRSLLRIAKRFGLRLFGLQHG